VNTFYNENFTEIRDTLLYDKTLLDNNNLYISIRSRETDSNLLSLINDILICYYSVKVKSIGFTTKTVYFSMLDTSLEHKSLINFIAINLVKMLECKLVLILNTAKEYRKPRWYRYVVEIFRRDALYKKTTFPYTGLDRFISNRKKVTSVPSNLDVLILFSISTIVRNPNLFTRFCESCKSTLINEILDSMYRFYLKEKKHL